MIAGGTRKPFSGLDEEFRIHSEFLFAGGLEVAGEILFIEELVQTGERFVEAQQAREVVADFCELLLNRRGPKHFVGEVWLICGGFCGVDGFHGVLMLSVSLTVSRQTVAPRSSALRGVAAGEILGTAFLETPIATRVERCRMKADSSDLLMNVTRPWR